VTIFIRIFKDAGCHTISIVPTVPTCKNVQHILGTVWRDQSKSTYCISEHTAPGLEHTKSSRQDL